MYNILIVEDEKKIRDLLEIYFIKENYTPFCREFGSRSLAKMFGVSKSTIVKYHTS